MSKLAFTLIYLVVKEGDSGRAWWGGGGGCEGTPPLLPSSSPKFPSPSTPATLASHADVLTGSSRNLGRKDCWTNP